MKKEKKVWAMTLIALWYLTPNLSFGQQDSVLLSRLNEVVVTATKFPKDQSETGKVLTVISEEQLARSGGKDLSQLLNEQVGLVINGAGSNPGKDKSVYLRGAKTDYTVILLDGIPLNDPSGFGGAFDLRLIPVDQVERIEILKGAQSTLYGSDAIAGVINIITKKKGDNPFGMFGNLGFGSYGTQRGNLGVRGSTNLIDYNVSVTRHKSEGISEAKDAVGGQGFDRDEFDQRGIQANVGIHATENWTINPFVRMNRFKGDFDGGSFTDSKATSTTEVFNTGIISQYTFDKGSVNFQYAHDKSERNYDYDGFKSKFDGRFNHAEAFATYNISEHVQGLAGVNIQHLRMVGTSTDKSILVTSPYASLFLSDLEGFTVELGARYVEHEQFGNAFTYSINPSYLLNHQLKIFASISTAFKAPTLSQLYGQYGANPNLDPEEAEHLEAGVHFTTLDQKADVRVTAFMRTIDDAIAYTSGYINLDKQEDYGFEIEPSYQANAKLKVSAFYAYVTGEITTPVAGSERDTTYNNLLRRPKHSVGLNISYQVTDRFFVSTNLKTFSKRNDRYFDSNDFSTKAVTLDGYALLDIYAEYAVLEEKQIKFYVDARNVLDTNYTEIAGYNTMGFNLMAGVTFGF
jgi:vitamin B12 transporter